MTKITSFLMLAEPDRLQYPYAESIASLASFSDCVIVNFAASSNPKYRQFEKESYDKLIMLREQFSQKCEIKIIMNETWSYQHEQTYDEIRCNIQNVLDKIDDGWFLKCDGDNVFQDTENIRKLFEDLQNEYHLVSFPRIDIINKNKLSINSMSRDIYAFNITQLVNDKIEFSISKDSKSWCRPSIDKNYKHFIVDDIKCMPFNYDATFFNRNRLINFWKKTSHTYEFTLGKNSHVNNLTDDQIVDQYAKYRMKKVGNIININHPKFIINKMNNLTSDFWGFDNFGYKI